MVVTLKASLLEAFLQYIEQDYARHCALHGICKTDEQLVKYLLDQLIVPTSEAYRYTILKEYQRMMTSGKTKKTEVVKIMASRFSISERTIWSVLKHADEKSRNENGLPQKNTLLSN
jgi:hypothetical protein